MSISEIKDSKPWWIPKMIWNMVINSVCDTAKGYLKISEVSDFAGNAMMEGLAKAIDGKNAEAVETVCTTIENSASVLGKASAAAKDGVITDDEKKKVSRAISATISALVSQSFIDTEIEEIRNELLFD